MGINLHIMVINVYRLGL